MSVSELLSDVSHHLKVVRDAENRFSYQLAPNFNVFQYLRDDEYGLSKCLADLLNPKGSHGQGDLFLKGFISLLPNKESFSPDKLKSIRLEYPTAVDRRIDILLIFNNGYVGVENKPWAGDQDNQLKHYCEYLNETCRKNEKWALVFASNRKPSPTSISPNLQEEYEKSNNFSQLQFKTIETWLRDSACKVQSLRVRLFVEELSNYIRENIGEGLDMADEKEVISVIETSDDFVRAASYVARSWDAMKHQLVSDFRQNLKDVCGNHNTLDYSEAGWKPLPGGEAYCGFYIVAQSFPKDILVSFQFDNAGFRNFFIGVEQVDASSSEGTTRSKTIFQTLKRKFDSGGKTAGLSWWAWADGDELLGEGFRDWNTSAEPWVAIRNGNLAERIVAISETIYGELGREFDIEEWNGKA